MMSVLIICPLGIYLIKKWLKWILNVLKLVHRSSFLSIRLLFSGFQISFPMFLNNLLCKKTSYCNCNRHLMFLCQECDILLLNEKLFINFQKCYIKRMKMFYERQDILK